MTHPTDTTPEPCSAVLVFEVRQASGPRLTGRLEARCTRGDHPAGTPHHGAAAMTGELVKWRAVELPSTDPQPARTITDARILEASLMSEGGPEHGVHPIESATPVDTPTRPARKPRKPAGS